MKKRPTLSVDVSDAISVATNANFNRLWGSQILSQVAQNLLNFALIIRVFELAQGTRLANVSVALLILSFTLPSLFFAAAAGVYVDHWNKKYVLAAVNFARAVLVLGYLLVEQNLWLVLILSFLISTATQFFVPAESAAIPSLVKPRQLLRANSLFVFTLYASFIAGYSASGPVVALAGAHGPYFLTAGMFAVAGILNLWLPSLRVEQAVKITLSKLVDYTVREVRANWRLIRSKHQLAFPMLQLTIGQALLGVIMALAPALSVAILSLPIQLSSHYLIIPAGIGLIAGVVAVEALARRWTKTRLIAGGVVVAAVSLAGLGATSFLNFEVAGRPILQSDQTGPLVAALVFTLGFVNAVVSVSAQTILQEHTTDAARGKVFGALGMLNSLAAALPVLVAGIAADLAGAANVVMALGLGLLVFALGQIFVLGRQGQLRADVD